MGKAVGLEKLYEPKDQVPLAECALSILLPEALINISGSCLTLPSIVFVHGLFGDCHKTWTKSFNEPQDYLSPSVGKTTNRLKSLSLRKLFSVSKGDKGTNHVRTLSDPLQPAGSTALLRDVFWPRDLLPVKIPIFRVFTWGYDADIDHAFSSASTATVFQHAGNLLSDLADVRSQDEQKRRPILFVAHSLGGIIVKDALNISRQSSTYLGDIATSTFGVIFLGTPHRGSPSASLAETIFRISKIWGSSPNLQVLQALKYDAETLERVQTGFKQTLQAQKIKVRSFRESQKYHGVMIVDRFSSTIDDPQEVISDLPGNHRDMTKFGSLQDPGFVTISGTLTRWIAEIKNKTDKFPRIMNALRADCLRSLNSSERRVRVEQVEDAYQDTFAWLFSPRVQFEDWLQDVSHSETAQPMFWIQGKPGSGKSTLMKYALRHKRTLDLLNWDPYRKWVLVPFFFHDRGSLIQKTVDGLLQEVLYQLLSTRNELLEFILPIRIHALLNLAPTGGKRHAGEDTVDYGKLEAILKDMDDDTRNTSAMKSAWTPQDVERSLMAITEQNEIPLRVCLFIDALDEHNGDHKRLIQIFQKLTRPNPGQVVNLKLCLASRPEPIFRDFFTKFPGFAIHEHTDADLHAYAYGRISSTVMEYSHERDLDQLHEVAEEITERASGVFVWVRLVVEELIEGVMEGDTIFQLRKIIFSIPEELQQLYRRVISRRKPQYALEAYIMFQIMLHTRTPQTLTSLMSITDVALFGKTETSSQESMLRRLMSRCGGLIELAGGSARLGTDVEASLRTIASNSSTKVSNDSVNETYQKDTKRRAKESRDGEVQFLHQTVKTFLQMQTNSISMFQTQSEIPLENGSTYLLKFCVHIATAFDLPEVEHYENELGFLRHLFPYAAAVEELAGDQATGLLDELLTSAKCGGRFTGESSYSGTIHICSRSDLELGSLSQSDLENESFFNIDGLHVWEQFCLEPSYPIYHKRPHFTARLYDLLVMAASHGLFHYVARRLTASYTVFSGRCPLVYSAVCSAFCETWARKPAFKLHSRKLLDVLFQHGAEADTEYNGTTALGYLIRSCSLSDSRHLSETSWQIIVDCLEDLLEHGADPNVPVGSPGVFTQSSPLVFALAAPRHAQKLANLLLDHGARFDQPGLDGFYPLYHTINAGNPDMTELLLSRGADMGNVGHGIDALHPELYDGSAPVRQFQIFAKRMHDLLVTFTPETNPAVRSRPSSVGDDSPNDDDDVNQESTGWGDSSTLNNPEDWVTSLDENAAQMSPKASVQEQTKRRRKELEAKLIERNFEIALNDITVRHQEEEKALLLFLQNITGSSGEVAREEAKLESLHQRHVEELAELTEKQQDELSFLKMTAEVEAKSSEPDDITITAGTVKEAHQTEGSPNQRFQTPLIVIEDDHSKEPWVGMAHA